MKEKEILISKVNGKVQHLSDIYPVIETNTILNKTITGIGATFSEIKGSKTFYHHRAHQTCYIW